MKKRILSIVVVLSCILAVVGMAEAKSASAYVVLPSTPEYDEVKAVYYANKYAINHNPSFVYFNEADGANFISQCVWAGNMEMDLIGNNHIQSGGKIIETSSKWFYYGDATCYVTTTAWIRCSGYRTFANYWYNYISATYTNLSKLKQAVSVGDVILIADANGNYKQGMIVVKKENGKVYCSMHSRDYDGEDIDNLHINTSYSYQQPKYSIVNFKK